MQTEDKRIKAILHIEKQDGEREEYLPKTMTTVIDFMSGISEGGGGSFIVVQAII